MIERLKILYWYYRTKQSKNFNSREALEKWQDIQVQKFLKKIIPASPFYRDYFQNLQPQNWQDLPTIDKSIMMENFDKLNTVGISKQQAFEIAYKAEQNRDFSPDINGITVGLSSGTSGNRGIFLASPAERQRWAGTILAKTLYKSILSKNKIAFFLRANSNLYSTINSKNLQFEYFDLLNPIEDHIKRLNQFQPEIIAAPPSMLRILADVKSSHQLKIAPQKIISVAEVLDELDKIYISKTFKQTVHQVYQCTEGFLASTCEHGTLHINEDLLIIQKDYIDKEIGKFIPIITDFSRFSQPIIRYRLNDILTEKKEACPCGSVFTAIEKIEGRCDDIFIFSSEDNTKLIQVFPDFISRAIIYSSDKIKEYKVIQHNLNSIEVFIDSDNSQIDEIREQITTSITKLLSKMNCKIPEITYSDKINKTPNKKFKRIERGFNIDLNQKSMVSV